MVSRISWVGLSVGAALGGITRVGVTALQFPGIFADLYTMGLCVALVGAVIGGLAGLTGRALRGAVAGAGLSALLHLVMLPIVGLFSFLHVATFPAWWEVLAVGAIPGAIGGWMGQISTKQRAHTGTVGMPGPA
jgi:hypothetical protein